MIALIRVALLAPSEGGLRRDGLMPRVREWDAVSGPRQEEKGIP